MRVHLQPQEVPWTVRLDEDREHHTYDPAQVAVYFSAASRAALVLAALRAPYRGRSTAVNAWWGSFDLAVALFSGRPAEPRSQGFIERNSGDAEEVMVGWWPGDARHPRAAFFAYASPAPPSFGDGILVAPGPALGPGAGRVPARVGRRHREPRPTRGGARVRALGHRPRLRGLQLGPRAGRQRAGRAAAPQLTETAVATVSRTIWGDTEGGAGA